MSKATIDRLKAELDSRFRRLAEWLNENDLDYAVILKEEIEVQSGNYLYYGGALTSGEYGAIVVDSSGERSAIVHEYSFERVKNSGLYSRVFEIRQSIEELAATLRRLLKDSNTTIDSSATQNATNLLRSSGINMADKNLRKFVFSQRSIKSEFEVREMERAIGIARRALESTIEDFKSGITTEDISRSLNKNILEEDGVGTSFETDVRIRRNLDEAETRKLAKGDLVLFDFGAKLSSKYLSDVGRTIPFSSGGDRKIRDFMNDVYSIKRAGLKKIVSGHTGNQVRAEIDQIIHEHGYDSTHRPGHQIGLNVHEPFGPALAYGKENSEQLQKGNVVTWEPGIGLVKNKGKMYKNRFGMAHMEDMVLVDNLSKTLGNFKLELSE
jgi:Xaa-Pro aminopeptidase